MTSVVDPVDPAVTAVREFNRFYTAQIGLLEDGLLSSPYSLTEVRVLFELARGGATFAGEIVNMLRLDPGYLSRILKGFETQGLIERRRSETDGRASIVRLTRQGRAVFDPLDQRASEQVAEMLAPLRPVERARLLDSMAVIRRTLEQRSNPRPRRITLRSHAPGDIGWAIERHGVLYADEYGWNSEFEGLVAKILGAFLEHHDPARERCWIGEVDGTRAGCVFLVQNAERADTAQLRCLLVEPVARGIGLGSRLVKTCIEFARGAGYVRIILWTNDVLSAARRIYEANGFELVHEERHHSFGQDLVGQTWGRDL
jgi:DNA-binding MarR family transcriptional regulator/GNAT superfamily N-acetyltransferase